MSFFTFNGRKSVRLDAPDPASKYILGDFLEKQIQQSLDQAAADAKALARDRAEAAKRQRAEDKAVAKLIGATFKE